MALKALTTSGYKAVQPCLMDSMVDPAMTAVGGAKKFKEMISRDIKAARKRRKDRKPDFKPKTYRGSKGRKLSLI